MVENINVSVEDEVCRNEEYLSKLDRNVKTKCSIQLVAENLSKIEVFRDAVAKYFAEKKYIIESCQYRTLDYVLYTFLLIQLRMKYRLRLDLMFMNLLRGKLNK